MFSRAFKGKGLRVIYVDGRKRLVKTGGSRAWRNNNPGNIRAGAHSRIHGSIARIDGFAIFPTYEDGKDALVWMLRKRENQNKTIFQLVSSYAPKEDRNDPVGYRKMLHQKTGLELIRKLKDLTDAELRRLVQGIQDIEGFKRGTEEIFDVRSFLAVRTDRRNVVVEYQVEKMGWKSKPEIVELVDQGRVDAVIVRRGDSIFIRTRPDNDSSNNLDAMKPTK